MGTWDLELDTQKPESLSQPPSTICMDSRKFPNVKLLIYKVIQNLSTLKKILKYVKCLVQCFYSMVF